MKSAALEYKYKVLEILKVRFQKKYILKTYKKIKKKIKTIMWTTIFKLSLLFVVAFGIPINDDDVEPSIEAVNTYLYGEPNPEWLNYLDEDGLIDHSRIQPPNSIPVPTETFYNAAEKVKFYLYTRKVPVRTEVLLEDLNSIKSTTFDRTHPLKFIVHGWQNDDKSDAIQYIRKAYLDKGDYNVFSVDWGKGANSLNYYTSRHRVGDVSQVLIRFITFILKEMNVKTSQVQLMGHSLGAHICGLTAKGLTIGRIPVIIGLDPAFPLFSMGKSENRLDIKDADYVEVIHTAAGSLGFDENIGTADFYPNYGKSQPGCGLDLVGSCAHSRAYEYFSESMNTESGFWSVKCGNYKEIEKKKCNATGDTVALGGDPIITTRANGVYHLETNKKKPFAKGS